MKFEIHITANEEIHEKANQLNIKTIIVDLLKPNLSVLRTEHMTSCVVDFDNYTLCKEWVDSIIKEMNINPIRVKIESPFYTEYVDQSLYIEAHNKFDVNQLVNTNLPLSRTQHRLNKLLSTDRAFAEIDKLKIFRDFKDQHRDFKEIELCLFDDFINEDLDWFSLYGMNNDKVK